MDKQNNIVNIINFIRGWTDKPEEDWQLLNTTKKEMEILKKYEFPSTFLMQYDALLREEYVAYIKENLDEKTEVGIWIEVVKPLVEKVGIKWRSEQDRIWDWHVNPGFLMAYTQKERELICDEQMRCFKEIFGFYPAVVGSWLLDSYSMDYMSRKYDIKAYSICRDQWGVDAYTLWGGYYNQGYYPSKYNMLTPAQTKENQINVPVFRMLGEDPIYEYDNKRYITKDGVWKTAYPLYTFEPNWTIGKNKLFANAFLENYFNENTLNFGYLQVGQENSFWWEGIKEGWKNEIELLHEWNDAGKIIIEKLSETGKKFKEKYNETPQTTISAENDWSDNGLKSYWYNCKNYRTNILLEKDKLIIRDIYKFKENYHERHYEEPETEWRTIYDNLPVIDAVLWSGDLKENNGIRSGMFFEGRVEKISAKKKENGFSISAVIDGKDIIINLKENGIEIIGDVILKYNYKKNIDTKISQTKTGFSFIHNNFSYNISIAANICAKEYGYDIKSYNNRILIELDL